MNSYIQIIYNFLKKTTSIVKLTILIAMYIYIYIEELIHISNISIRYLDNANILEYINTSSIAFTQKKINNIVYEHDIYIDYYITFESTMHLYMYWIYAIYIITMYSIPLIQYELIMYITPSLYRHEKKYITVLICYNTFIVYIAMTHFFFFLLKYNIQDNPYIYNAYEWQELYTHSFYHMQSIAYFTYYLIHLYILLYINIITINIFNKKTYIKISILELLYFIMTYKYTTILLIMKCIIILINIIEILHIKKIMKLKSYFFIK